MRNAKNAKRVHLLATALLLQIHSVYKDLLMASSGFDGRMPIAVDDHRCSRRCDVPYVSRAEAQDPNRGPGGALDPSGKRVLLPHQTLLLLADVTLVHILRLREAAVSGPGLVPMVGLSAGG